jgi:tetratricopeptide (TPR) repeat protein
MSRTRALRLIEESLTLQKAKNGVAHPDTIYSMNELAWVLSTISDTKLRNPRRAIELASAVVNAVPTRGDYRGTLGTAQYRAGEWRAAIANLEQAIQLRKADEARHAFNGFFIAMSHWRLGEKNEALEWYDKSVAWMNKGLSNDPELKRWRSEAAELLGLEIKP